MSDPLPGLGPKEPPEPPDDNSLVQVATAIMAVPDFGRLFGEVFRQAFDEVLDGQRTGRYDVRELSKTEKTYIGTKVEILLQNVFRWSRGQQMDFSIAGHEVDSKYSQTFGGWMIPTEAVRQLCLLLWADDTKSTFSVGLFRPAAELLGRPNKDHKRQLNPSGRTRVHWLLHRAHMPENLLLHLTPDVRSRVLASGSSGQARIDELFRSVPNRIVRREVVVAVGQQDDAPKRVRDARKRLAPEGMVILGHLQNDRAKARKLGLPEPVKGEWISTHSASTRTEGTDPDPSAMTPSVDALGIP